MRPTPAGDCLGLTEEEAYSLLSLCLTSPGRLDAASERALLALARYCVCFQGASPCPTNHGIDNCLETRPSLEDR
jgi:hypothetical protein